MNADPRAPLASSATQSTLAVETTAEAYLSMLAQRGIERLFVNAGTDFASIVEAYARQPQSGLRFPEYTVCAHETVAFGMAHGHYLATGRPAAVMVHVSVGTANTVCGLMNAARDHSPVLLTAGRNPLFEHGRKGARAVSIHWAQEMYDQAGMVRELVKWDYELRDGLQVPDVVDRALSIAMAAPRGPVYLTLPREVLAQAQQQVSFPAVAPAIPTDPSPDPRALATLRGMIEAAKRPVIIANEAGRERAAVAALAAAAERLGVGVVELPRALFLCLPASHPLHLGNDQVPVLAKADLVIVLSADVPWIPLLNAPAPGAKVVHVAADPLYSNIPIRTFPADLSITASTGAFLRALAAGEAVPGAEARKAALAPLRAAARELRAKRLADARTAPRIHVPMLNACLDELRPRDAIVVNEYWTDRTLVDFDEPGTFFSHSMAGGLGWGLPAALGIQQANPGRTVIATLGDGAYVFANPVACHMVAQTESLPVLTIVNNNSHWAAVKRATLQVYPGGHASKVKIPPMSGLDPSPAFEKYVEASGGHGERVETPADLLPAMRRALDVVRNERRQAVLNVLCD